MLDAWSCIGLVPTTHYVRKVGGTALYEDVLYNDATSRSGDLVKLARLGADQRGLREVSQWVRGSTPVELVAVQGGKVATEHEAKILLGIS